jgi:hypothetical protein
MKKSLSFALFIMIIINIISNNKVVSEEIEDEQIKPSKNIEENDEFDDPSLLKKESAKKKKKKEKQNSNTEEKKSDEQPNKDKDNDNIYPSLEQLRQEKTEEINKYKYFAMKYLYEICMISLVLIFILNVIYGVKKNRSIANKWLVKNRAFFEDNYSHLGGEREYNPNNLSLIKDSYNDYKFFASGRVYVSWMIVDINLKRRQDLISLLSQLLLFGEKDRIMYEISLSPTEDVPCIFSICKRKDIKYTKKNYREVNEFTEVVNPSYMDKNYVLLTEDEEVVNKIFSNKQFLSQYKKIENFLELIFFTDRRNAKDKHGMVVSFELKGSYTEADLYDMTIFTHMLIDILGATSVKASYKKEANARRKEFEAKLSRELAEKNKEEIQNAKEEKKNAAKNKPMTREQLKKKEEKERKDAIKERRKKLFKMVKA